MSVACGETETGGGGEGGCVSTGACAALRRGDTAWGHVRLYKAS